MFPHETANKRPESGEKECGRNENRRCNHNWANKDAQQKNMCVCGECAQKGEDSEQRNCVQKSGIRLKANAPSAEAEATEVTERTNDSSSFRPANTVLTGLNYLKNQSPVLSLADEEYPEWLWGITKPVVLPDDGPGGKAERRRMRQENRETIKDQNFMRTQ